MYFVFFEACRENKTAKPYTTVIFVQDLGADINQTSGVLLPGGPPPPAAPYHLPPTARGLTTFELHKQFTQALDRGMHVRTGYMHGGKMNKPNELNSSCTINRLSCRKSTLNLSQYSLQISI